MLFGSRWLLRRLFYNILFVISDQHTHRQLAGPDYGLPALETIARHGVTFRNHYIAAEGMKSAADAK